MQFCEVKPGEYFSARKSGTPCIFRKTGETMADYIAIKKGLFIWHDIDWYDPIDAVTKFEPGDSVDIGRDVEDYLF